MVDHLPLRACQCGAPFTRHTAELGWMKPAVPFLSLSSTVCEFHHSLALLRWAAPGRVESLAWERGPALGTS